jgi:HK97 gp10 family phage protein
VAEREIEGLPELQAALDALSKDVAKRALRLAARRAGEALRSEAISRAPEGTEFHTTYKGRKVAPGFLSRNIALKTRLLSRQGAFRVSVGPSKEAFYGSQFVELGIPSRGIPARPWLVPALMQNAEQIHGVFKAELRAAIERIARRSRAATASGKR